MHKNREIRTAASLIVSMILSAALFLLFFSIEIKMGYLSPKVFRDSLRISNYGSEMEQEMLLKQRELFASYGLPESLTEEIWEENEAYLAFSKYVDSEKGKSEGSIFGQQEVLEDYLKGQNVYETESVRETIKTVAAESSVICSRYVYSSFISDYRQFVQERNPALTGMMIVSVAVGIICIVLLFGWYHYRHHALRYVTGSFFTAWVWNLAGTTVIRHSGGFPVSGVEPLFYKKFLEIYQSRGMYSWYAVDGMAAGMTILLVVAGIHMRKQR